MATTELDILDAVHRRPGHDYHVHSTTQKALAPVVADYRRQGWRILAMRYEATDPIAEWLWGGYVHVLFERPIAAVHSHE